MTEHGKVDRNALPAPDLNDQLTHEYVAPRNPTEAKLRADLGGSAGVEKIGVHDNFFELGGDSILSIQIISRARQFGIAITSKTFFSIKQSVRWLKILLESNTLNKRLLSRERLPGACRLSRFNAGFLSRIYPFFIIGTSRYY
ncbi:phosphopantetheine-binding protein [Nitrosomonas sp.]|uniref:phosphopantetheine-binding protein n=1 Tax=Nitrosomonas sp. TaxID=42353 RepID=UPI00283E2590|nr:phosphopantetheine-binding protein [Nitrosomonas sp.]MDR4515769.1 phosphopantetheine-binding protein [Nitrosomonas sp.]